MLAVKDEKNPALFWIVEVYCLAEDDEAHCHFWATTNPSIQRAKFKRVWVERGTGLSILAYRPKAHERADSWMGLVTRDEVTWS